MVEDICQRLQADTQTLDVLPPQVRVYVKYSIRRCIWTSLNKADDVIRLHQLQPTAAVAGFTARSGATVYRPSRTVHSRMVRRLLAISLQQSEFAFPLRSAKNQRQYRAAAMLAQAVPTPSKSGRKSTTKRQGCVLYYNESHHYRFINNLFL